MTDKPTKILVVEDEKSFSDALNIGLTAEGFAVRCVANGRLALASIASEQFDIVLLDLMLPGVSGIDVCREIRRTSDVPVIITTAKDSELDKVLGLEMGADDYVTKPYSLREVIARMRAVLRRVESRAGATLRDVVTVGPIELDIDRHSVKLRGKEVTLPLREYELLEALMLNAGKAVTRTSLLDDVWGYGYHGATKTLDVHVQRLRTRIEDDPSEPRLIKTIRGVGYRFEIPTSEADNDQ